MTLCLKIKTNRSKSGYANAKLSRHYLMFFGRYSYCFQFYNVCKFFKHHNELRSFVLEQYNIDIGNREQFWGI